MAFAAACAWNPEAVDRQVMERTFWRQFFAVEDPQPFIRLDEILGTVGRSAFDDWWRHPVIGPSPRGMIAVHKDGAVWGATLREKAAAGRSELEKARAAAKANLWFLDIFSLTIDMCDALGAKFIWMDHCSKAGPGRLPAANAGNLSRSAREIRERMAALRAGYSDLWLRHNRPEGLGNILSLWDRQILYWDTIVESLERDRTPGPAVLASGWIAPAAGPARKNSGRERTAYYAADLSIPAGTDSVKILLMGESHVEAWAGGKWAGRKVARLSLSEIVDRNRAVLVDLSGLLIPGMHRLAFSVTNYEGKVPALNVYGEIYSGGKISGFVKSSAAWRGTELDSAPPGWNTSEFDLSAWPPCAGYKAESPVSRPFFAQGLPSRVER